MSPQHDNSKGGKAPHRLDPKKLLRAAAAAESRGQGPQHAWQAPSVDEVQQRFPELEITDLVGRGGMGAVYRAVQTRLGRTVALKVLPPEVAADPAFEERFLREARALAGLQHPRILTIHDFGERDGFYLVTEFVEGMSLRELMDMGELSPTEALRITPQICEALQFAHDRGVVHRDIKPENLLIDGAGDVKIADFGLAQILGEAPGPALTRSTQILGTPHYMAPEQWRHGVPVDHRADIYSVGVVLYEMLTGQLPLGHFEPPSSKKAVPPGLDAVVQRSLAQQPEQRYQRAGDVVDDLQQQRLDPHKVGTGNTRPEERHSGRANVKAQLIASWILALPLLVMNLQGNSSANDFPGLFLATPLLMIVGFWAVRQIRRRRQGTGGLGLAIFTTWIVPLGIVIATAISVVNHKMIDSDLAPLVSVIAGIALGIAGIVGMISFHRRLTAELAS